MKAGEFDLFLDSHSLLLSTFHVTSHRKAYNIWLTAQNIKHCLILLEISIIEKNILMNYAHYMSSRWKSMLWMLSAECCLWAGTGSSWALKLVSDWEIGAKIISRAVGLKWYLRDFDSLSIIGGESGVKNRKLGMNFLLLLLFHIALYFTTFH